jgi:hypothetical protein
VGKVDAAEFNYPPGLKPDRAFLFSQTLSSQKILSLSGGNAIF